MAALLALFAITCACPAPGQEAKPKKAAAAPKLTAEQKAKNVESFDVLWKTIRDTHYDPTLGGVDWQKVREEFGPKVEKAASMADARAAMTRAIDRLNRSHFGIIPAEVYKDLENPNGGPGDLGIELRIIDDRAVVTRVVEGSAADKEGVRPGWTVEKVGERTTKDVLAAVEKAFHNRAMWPSRKALTIMSLMRGPVGAFTSIGFRDREDHERNLKLAYAEPKGFKASFGNLPDFHVRYESKRIDQSIGYIGLNIFFDLSRVLSQFAQSVSSFRDTDGLIIDLRGNPGGIGAMAIGLGGWFVTEPDQKLGTMITRDSSMNFALNPRSTAYDGPVAILVDELSMSTSEILAGGLQDLKRARIFGTKTPGAALPSRFDVLPNGDRFQYAFANYISFGGKPLEGLGVTPDVVSPVTLEALRAGHDPALEAAASWIHSQRSK
jgi:carboxyl-terminal processing protease